MEHRIMLGMERVRVNVDDVIHTEVLFVLMVFMYAAAALEK
jgi:hypothetical protein